MDSMTKETHTNSEPKKSRREMYKNRKSNFWTTVKHGLNVKENAQKDNCSTPLVVTCLFFITFLLAILIWSLWTGVIMLLLLSNMLTICYFMQKQSVKLKQENKDNNPVFHMKFKYNEERTNNTSYEVICDDAIKWLQKQTILEGFVVTSLPDYTEVPHMTREEWKVWFSDAVTLILEKLPEGASCIFYQTDVKITELIEDETDYIKRTVCQEYIDKAHLCNIGAAKVQGVKQLWHKILLTSYVGSVKIARPGYSHMLCFGKNAKDYLQKYPLPDILDRGEMIYPKATGINACMLAMIYCKNAGAKTIIDPFCGMGSILLAANYMGLNAIGIDIGTTRCREAKKMRERNMQHFVDVVRTKSFLSWKEK